MGRQSPLDPKTRRLIEDVQARRRRRRLLRVVAASAGALVLLTALAAAAVLGLAGERVAAVSTTGSSSPASTSTSLARTATTPPPPPRPSTTETAPTTTSTEVTSTAPTDPPSTSPPAAAAGDSGSGAPIGIVTIDPGHQARGNSSPEPIGPGSAETKAKVSSGTRGVATGTPEHELTLAVGLLLRRELEARNVRVVMTRTSADVDLSNAQRAKLANQAGSDLFIRIHADGSGNSSTHGIHVLYPASTPGWTDDIAAASERAAQITQRHLIAATGARDLGINPRSDITGFNWSDVPVILPEIGFMTNSEEDRRLATSEYRAKIARALAEAAVEFIKG
ncbi:MAG: hypothetical protein Kow00129_06840 [Thermoleophilia bacterium]